MCLDMDEHFYVPGIGDQPPIAYTYREIEEMLDKAYRKREIKRLRERLAALLKQDEEDLNLDDVQQTQEPEPQDDAMIAALGIRADEPYYSKELGRRVTYAEMVEGMDPEDLPQNADDLELLLWCFDAVSMEECA